jgi:AraC-like DNA-binding protein/mannose-6-phosphate isomerase-like protein (cupin superfamily)
MSEKLLQLLQMGSEPGEAGMDRNNPILTNLAAQVEFVHTRRQPRTSDDGDMERRKSHRHEMYEIYRFLAGDANYFIENRMYDMTPGQLFVIRSDEFHNLSVRTPLFYEKIAVRFPRELAIHLSGYGTDLLACFDDRPRGVANKVAPDETTTRLIDDVLARMEALYAEPGTGDNPVREPAAGNMVTREPAARNIATRGTATHEPAARKTVTREPALRVALLMELLVLVNRVHQGASADMPARPVASSRLEPVLGYIEAHLAGDLSVKALAQAHFMSGSTLCKLFRETTGVGLHAYVTYRRVERAREALLQGANVTDACAAGGFNDYASFIRTFRKVTGLPPGKYKRQQQEG